MITSPAVTFRAGRLRADLATGSNRLLGTFVIIPRLEVVEIAAAAGFTVVIVDLEHGSFGVESVPPLVAAAHGKNIQVLVRVADSDAGGIGAALDTGADGVLVPHVSSAEQAARVVAAARFAPEGERGANPWTRAGGYGTDADFFATANDRAAVIAMVEGVDGIANLDEITSVSGLDAIFVGPVDLSAALGLPGRTEHPRVIELVADIVARASRSGVATAVFAPTPGAAVRWFGSGVSLVALGVDTNLIYEGFRAAHDAVDELSTTLANEAATK